MAKKEILIVEDERPLVTLLRKRLEAAGFDVTVATNGEEAIKKVKHKNPDLILLDLVLPKKNGFDVLEDIRVKMQLSMPIIILSNLGQKKDRETVKNLGADEFIEKANVSMRQLVPKIRKYVDKKEAKSKKKK